MLEVCANSWPYINSYNLMHQFFWKLTSHESHTICFATRAPIFLQILRSVISGYRVILLED